MRAIVAALATLDDAPRWRPLLLTAIFTGLRASEFRGLRWDDIDLKRGELHVRQRADRYGKIGRTKSEAGERTVPLPPMVVAVLREHRLACQERAWPRLPQQQGRRRSPHHHRQRGLQPVQIAAGVVDQTGGEVQGPARAAALLRVMVHQPACRWRARTAVEGGTGAARSRLHPDDR